MNLTIDDGKKLIKLARDAIYKNISSDDTFQDKAGVFVTLHTYPNRRLRGCVGYPFPIMQLGLATIKAAKGAAYADSRFKPLGKHELIVIDVSVLTPLQQIKDVNEIKIGRDGLMIEYMGITGLLLPIVAVEQGWNVQQFLEHTCIKAGLKKDTWKHDKCRIFIFQTIVFSEKTPEGEIEVRY